MMTAFGFTTLMTISNATNETIVPGSENGLIVALGGIVGVVLFLTIILLKVLGKRKKNAH